MKGMKRIAMGLMAILTLVLFGLPSTAVGQQRRPVVPPVETSHGPDSLALDPRGRAPAVTYCGQGHFSHDTTRAATNGNEGRTLGIVYRPYNTGGADGGFCRGRTLLHELGHNLGALQKVAPNAFDGAHCDDDDNDVMCYTSEAQYDSGSAQFDYLRDDYWDPAAVPTSGSTTKLGWWATNLSSWICPVTGCKDSNPQSSHY